MKIIIHRGIDQIGGCITEIATDNAKILIDLGQNHPDGEGIVNDDIANFDAIEQITKGIDAIFYTHYYSIQIIIFWRFCSLKPTTSRQARFNSLFSLNSSGVYFLLS